MYQDGGINYFTGRPYSDRFKRILAKRKELAVYDKMAAFYEMVGVLPVWVARSAQLFHKFDRNQVCLYVGETGSGKTTQLVFISPRESSGSLITVCQDTPVRVLQRPTTPERKDGCLHATQANRRHVRSEARCR